jgi:DNA-binding XRE family transcriptional regulator
VPNIAQLLKYEIQRLARKETRTATRALKADLVALKSVVRVLRDKVAEMQKAAVQRGAVSRIVAAKGNAGDGGAAKGMRYDSKGLRSLRMRLGVSQREMAQLIGVSGQAVYLWESKGTKLRLRNETREALLKLKGIGKRAAHKLIEAK